LHDLADDDIHSRPLESPLSALASTGIEFKGLEQLNPIPLQEWHGRPEPGAASD
jgi:hypothetical protein